jgi:hypothetical protein
MIADDREGPIETALKVVTAPVWVPIYLAYVGCRKLAEARASRKPKPVEPEILSPVQPWQPSREFERAVYAALILAGEPVNNRRLAELMACSPGEASRRGRATRGRDPQGPQGS